MQSNQEALQALLTDQRLGGRTAIVTGSTSGIGEAIAHVLAASGATVVVSGRDKDRAHRAAETISRSGRQAVAVSADLSAGYDQVRAFAREARDALGGRVDILVNNAGIYPVGATKDLPDTDLDAMLAINVRAPHVLMGELAPAMAERGTGAVVNIGSWMARVGSPYGAMYTATKAALEQLTRAWAAEYGPRGVRVNTVAPGATATPGNEAGAELLATMTEATVAGRPVRPVDIAFAVRYVVSDEAGFVHAATIDVDGGISHTRLS